MQNTCCFHLLDPKKLDRLPWRLIGKESACQCRRCRFSPSVGQMPWRREWQPTPLFLPGKSHEQRGLAGYSPWGPKESDTTKQPTLLIIQGGLPRWLSGKESACQCRRCRFNPWVGEIPWRRKWQPTPVFLPGKYQGQRSLVGYSPWDRESQT